MQDEDALPPNDALRAKQAYFPQRDYKLLRLPLFMVVFIV